MAYVVDPLKFKAEGAYTDWAVVARRLKIEYQGKNRNVLHLRWMTHRELGMPTEPFIVWRRPKGMQGLIPLNIDVEPQLFLFGARKVEWTNGPMMRVFVQVTATSAGSIIAYAGSPIFSNFNAIVPVVAGSTTIVVSASIIEGLLLTPGVDVTSVTGIPLDQLTVQAGWQKLEYVGLPFPLPEWNGIWKYDSKQGMVTALTEPQTAALQRLERGAPQVGWQPNLPSGELVPPWLPPDTFKLVTQEIRTAVINRLKLILPNTPPNQQYDKKITVTIPPPENSSGQKMPVDDTTTQISPVAGTLMPASVDPWLALSLGYGTAYPVTFNSATIAVIPNALDYDYMITARWEKGLDGNSAPYEMAALVPAPTQAIAPPAPANLYTEMMGHIRPPATDADWRCSVKASWDRPADLELIRPRTYAFMRSSVSPVQPVQALMNPRESGGYRYPVINSAIPSPPPPDWWQISDVDRELPIPANPGSRSLRYGVAHQDIYGQWSTWSVANGNVSQPPVDRVRIVTAKLDPALPVAPQTSLCKGVLTIEFLWDWRIRRPEKIRFVGRLYAAAHRGDPPPITSPSAVLERSLSHAGTSLDITFVGDTPTAVGATFDLLSEDGENIVANGPAQGFETRRYRVKVPNFDLDFATTGHIGLALWALGQERIPPQRSGVWSPDPSVIAVSDPRPPKMVPDIVTLASLPDAGGECHARLSWGTSSATGYFIYESTETKILLANGQSEPPPEKTLSERLTTIKQLFQANPSKRDFTRKNEKPIVGTSADVTLPRGSTSIHIYLVIGISAGQVESDWPSGPDADDKLQAIAAPRVMKPAPPTIEVQPFVDKSFDPPVYRARVQVGARPGPRVRKVQLFRVRVDDAAKELDTMGPALATITGSGGGWNVDQVTDSYGINIKTVTGLDSPNGSWKRVWYRAAAWSDPDPLRGYLAGRSGESTAAWVVVPPPTPPNLSAVNVSWPSGGALGDILLQWTSSVPIRKTPLGPHTLTVRAVAKGIVNPLINFTSKMDEIPQTQPGVGSGVWLANPDVPAPRHYAAYIRRVSENDAVTVTIQITDPIGRMSERVVQIPPGALLPPPSLGKFQVKVLALPAGTLLTFAANALVDLEDTPYVLRVTAYRPFILPITPISGRTMTPEAISPKIVAPKIPITPVIPKLDPKVPITPVIPIGPIIKPQLSVSVELPVPDIPLDANDIPPIGSDPLLLRRVPNPGGGFHYYAFCRVSVQRFIVRLTSPDGRTDEHTEVVS